MFDQCSGEKKIPRFQSIWEWDRMSGVQETFTVLSSGLTQHHWCPGESVTGAVVFFQAMQKMFESQSCSLLLHSFISQHSSDGKLSTTYELHVISKWLRNEPNFCCGYGSSKHNKCINTPDKIKEGLDERTHLEHIPQLTALLHSTGRTEVAPPPFLFACQCHAQANRSHALEQSTCLRQFL